MTRHLAEILLFASLVLNASLLIFIAGVLKKVMNEMDEAAFKRFLDSLVRHSKRSPFMIVGLNLPLLGAIPYFFVYGLGNRWLLAGLILWLLAGSIAKAIKLPIYNSVATANMDDTEKLRTARDRINSANLVQAILNSVAALLALVPFTR